MVALALLAVAVAGRIAMTEAVDAPSEADRLEATLFGMEVSKFLISTRFQNFSDTSKNDVVARLGQNHPAPLPGRVLARLPYIATAQNRTAIVALYRRDLGSRLPAARQESLYGLERLGEPDAVIAARGALGDDDDGVLVAAISILLPRARQDPDVWRLLQRAYQARKDDARLYNSMGLLRDSKIEGPPPK